MAPPSSPSGNRPVGGPERTDGLADETRPDRATTATTIPSPANDGATGFTAEPSDAVRLRRMAGARPAVDDGFYSFRYPPPNGRYPEPRIPFRADPIPLVTSLYRRTGHENRTFVRWTPPEVFKTFVDQQELESDLVWAVQLERMGIPAPGIDYVAARLTTTLTSGPHGLPYQGYRMKNAYSPYEGWEVIDLRPGAASPDLATLFGNRLQKVYSNLLAIHATLAANGVWHMDGVQFAANSRTGDVVLLDYGSFDIFDGPLFRERLESGFLKKTAADFRMETLPEDAVHLKMFLRDVGREVAALWQKEISRCPEPQRTLLTVAEEFLAELEEGQADAFFFPLAGSWVDSGRSGFFRSFIYQSIDRELAARMTGRGYPTWGEAVRSQIRGMMGEPGPMNWIAERIAGWVDRYEPLLSDEGVGADSVLALLLKHYEAEERRMTIVGIRRGEELVEAGAMDRDFFDRIRGRLARKPFDEQALSFHEVEFAEGDPATDNSEFRNLELFLFRIQEGFRGQMKLVHETGGEGAKKVRLLIPSIRFVEAALQEFYPDRFSHSVYERGEADPDVMQARQVKGVHTIGLFTKKGPWGDFIGPREFSGAFLTLHDVYHAVDKTIHAAHLYELSDVLYQAFRRIPPPWRGGGEGEGGDLIHPAIRAARLQLLDLEIADGFTPRDLLLKVWLPIRVYFLAGEDKLLELVNGDMTPEELSHPAVRNDLLHLALSFIVSEEFRMEARNRKWAPIEAKLLDRGYSIQQAQDASLAAYDNFIAALIAEIEKDERKDLSDDPLHFLRHLRGSLATEREGRTKVQAERVPQANFTEEDALGWRIREGVDPVLVDKILGRVRADDVLVVVHPLPDFSRRESAVRFNRDVLALMVAAHRAGVPSLLVQSPILRSGMLSRRTVAMTDDDNGRIEGRFDSDRVTLAGGELTGCLNVAMRSLARAAVGKGRQRLTIRLVAEGVYHLTEGGDGDPATSLARTLASLPAKERTPYLRNLLSTGFRFPSFHGNLPEGTTVVLTCNGEDHVLRQGTGEFTLALEVDSAAGLFGGPEGKSESGEGEGEALRRALVVETQRRGLSDLTTTVALLEEKRLLALAKGTVRWLEFLRRLGYGDLAKALSGKRDVSQTDRLLMMIAAVSGNRKVVGALASRYSSGGESGAALSSFPMGTLAPVVGVPRGIPVLMGR